MQHHPPFSRNINISVANYMPLSSLLKTVLKQAALLSQRGCAMLRVCIASIQNVERSLLLLVVSASDTSIALRTIKFFSGLFSSAYSSMLQAVTNKHSMVRRRLCDLHSIVVGNCFCHFVVRTSSNRSIASYRRESRFLPIPHLHLTPPLGEFPSECRHPVWSLQDELSLCLRSVNIGCRLSNNDC